MVPKISLCMIVRDEEAFIGRCLEAASPFVDEIVVIDTGSTDQTLDIARAHGALTDTFPWRDDFATARNRSLDKATGDWILYLDADEILTGDPASLRQATETEDLDAYFVELYNVLTEGTLQRDEQVPVLRFFRNLPGNRFTGPIHEQIAFPVNRVGRLGPEVGIVHDGYLPSVVASKKKERRNLDILLAIQQAESDPSLRNYYEFQTGREYQRMGEWSAAIGCYNQVIAESDRLRPVYWPLAFQYSLESVIRLRQWQTALEVSEGTLNLFPAYTEVLRLKATVLVQLGRTEQAKQTYLLALSQPEDRPWLIQSMPRIKEICWSELGILFESEGNAVSAVACYQKVLALNPDACFALQRILDQIQRADGAAAVGEWIASLLEQGRFADTCRESTLAFLESRNLFDAYLILASSKSASLQEAV